MEQFSVQPDLSDIEKLSVENLLLRARVLTDSEQHLLIKCSALLDIGSAGDQEAMDEAQQMLADYDVLSGYVDYGDRESLQAKLASAATEVKNFPLAHRALENLYDRLSTVGDKAIGYINLVAAGDKETFEKAYSAVKFFSMSNEEYGVVLMARLAAANHPELVPEVKDNLSLLTNPNSKAQAYLNLYEAGERQYLPMAEDEIELIKPRINSIDYRLKLAELGKLEAVPSLTELISDEHHDYEKYPQTYTITHLSKAFVLIGDEEYIKKALEIVPRLAYPGHQAQGYVEIAKAFKK